MNQYTLTALSGRRQADNGRDNIVSYPSSQMSQREEIPMSFTRVNVIENDLKPAAFLRIPNQMAVPEFKRAQKDRLKIGR